MAAVRDVESVIADYLGQFTPQDPEMGPAPEAGGLVRWLADEGWTIVPARAGGAAPVSGDA